MVFHPHHIDGGQLEVLYTRRMMGVVPSFTKQQWERVCCSEFAVELAAEPLAAHSQYQQGMGWGAQWEATPL